MYDWLGQYWWSKKWTQAYVNISSLAGDRDKRVNMLKAVMLSAIRTPTQESFAGEIVYQYANGPGLNLKRFSRWAQRPQTNADGSPAPSYYEAFGWTRATFGVSNRITVALLQNYVPEIPGYALSIQESQVAYPMAQYFAMAWLADNHPEVTSYGGMVVTQATNESTTFTITLPGHGPFVMPVPAVEHSTEYLYAFYQYTQNSVLGAMVTGTPQVLPTASLPDLTTWSQQSYSAPAPATTTTIVTTVVTTPAEGDPETAVDTTYVYGTTVLVNSIHTWEFTLTASPTLRTVRTEWGHRIDSVGYVNNTESSSYVDPYTGSTVATTIVTTSPVAVHTWRVDHQDTTTYYPGPAKMFIYRAGSGQPVLDDFMNTSTDAGEIVPVIPVRLLGSFLSEEHMPILYAQCKKAMKKALPQTTYDSLINKLKTGDAEKLSYCINAYLEFGAAANSPNQKVRRYIYEFFRELMNNAQKPDISMQAFIYEWQQENAKRHAIYTAQAFELLPTQQPYPIAPSNAFRCGTHANFDNGYSIALQWLSISETTYVGLSKPTAKLNELWWEVLPTTTLTSISLAVEHDIENTEDGQIFHPRIVEYTQPFDLETGPAAPPVEQFTIPHVRLYWQVSLTEYRVLDLFGMQHLQNLYASLMVGVSLTQALANETDEQRFIIPLHTGVLGRTPLVAGGQLGLEAGYLVFYSVVEGKTPWYGHEHVRIIVTIIAIVVSYFTSGTTTKFWVALLEAMMLYVAIEAIAWLVERIWGKKAGIYFRLAAAVYSAIYGNPMGTTEVVGAVAVSETMSAMSILTIVSAIGNSYSQLVQLESTKLLKEASDVAAAHNVQMDKIKALYEEFGGNSMDLLDPMAAKAQSDKEEQLILRESPETFLSRTLITGGDVAAMSHSMIGDFANMTLATNVT
jgi:hypothetical protein